MYLCLIIVTIPMMDESDALQCVRDTFRAVKYEFEYLKLDETYHMAIDHVDQQLGSSCEVFADIYCRFTKALSEFVLSNDDRSDAVYDIMLMLLFRTGKAFQVLYPFSNFVQDNCLYFNTVSF